MYVAPVPVVVMSWNINGDLELKLDDENFVALLKDCDVVLLQETHLLPSQHESLCWPRGYAVYSCPRPFPPHLDQQWGGVLALVRSSVHHEFRADIAPEGSPALLQSDPDPVERYIGALTACRARASKPVHAYGDWNYRSGNIQPARWASPRASEDSTVDTRGRNLTGVLELHEMAIVNGTLPGSAAFTSFQPRGRSVIDYFACTRLAMLDVCEMNVGHAPSFTLPPIRARFVARNATATARVDQALEGALSLRLSPEEAAGALYGVLGEPVGREFVSVYTDGSCFNTNTPNARAGSGACFGLRAAKNLALRVPGGQTNNRGELWAVLQACMATPPERPLRVFTDSEHVIHTLCHWAAAYAMTGWPCANADLIVPTVNLLAARPAATRFDWVPAHSGNVLNDEADKLAKLGASKPAVEMPDDLPSTPPEITEHGARAAKGGHPKVFTELPATAEPGPRAAAELRPHDVMENVPAEQGDRDDFHRGRRARRMKAAENLCALERVQNDAEFWKFVLHVTHPRSREAAVAMYALQTVFMGRMNAPLLLPPEFSAERVSQIKAWATAIPDATMDGTEKRYFSRKFTAEDIARLKARIRSRPPGKSTGFDKAAFQVRVCGSWVPAHWVTSCRSSWKFLMTCSQSCITAAR